MKICKHVHYSWDDSKAASLEPVARLIYRSNLRGSLAKYVIPYTDEEGTESLVNKFAQFYADRTLTTSPITLADQAEACFLLVSERLSNTTGQVITVDGGLHGAFPR